MTLDVGETASLIIAIGGAGAVIVTGARWLLSALDKRVRAQLQPITAEVTRNGGGSLKDKVDEIAVAVRANTESMTEEHVETRRRHENNVRVLRRLDAEMSVVRRAVLAGLLRHDDGSERSARLSELEQRILDQLQAHEELARDRRTGRWSDGLTDGDYEQND